MSEEYFSDEKDGPRMRTEGEISDQVWRGILALIRAHVETGAFGADFPQACREDGVAAIGTDAGMFWDTLRLDIPQVPWPPDESKSPSTAVVMDMLQFCYRHVAEPTRDFEKRHKHDHLRYLEGHVRDAQERFRSWVNSVFSRNALAYEMKYHGHIEHLDPPVLRESLGKAEFQTGDDELDRLLNTAREKFLKPDFETRRESLEKLWDAFERIKTLEEPGNKKASAELLLDKAASDPNIRTVLGAEMTAIWKIGNDFVRHSEMNKPVIGDDAHVDYLFHRLFALVWLLLRKHE